MHSLTLSCPVMVIRSGGAETSDRWRPWRGINADNAAGFYCDREYRYRYPPSCWPLANKNVDCWRCVQWGGEISLIWDGKGPGWGQPLRRSHLHTPGLRLSPHTAKQLTVRRCRWMTFSRSMFKVDKNELLINNSVIMSGLSEVFRPRVLDSIGGCHETLWPHLNTSLSPIATSSL